jgi:hypothetical protein
MVFDYKVPNRRGGTDVVVTMVDAAGNISKSRFTEEGYLRLAASAQYTPLGGVEIKEEFDGANSNDAGVSAVSQDPAVEPGSDHHRED